MLATGVVSRKKPRESIGATGGLEERLLQQIEKLEGKLLDTQKKGDLVEESRLCNNLAKKYEQLGDFKRAITYHHYDRQISEAVGDVEGLLLAISNMAEACLQLEMKDLAKSFYQEQLDVARKHQIFPQRFAAHSAIGKLYLLESEVAPCLVKKEKLVDAGIEFYHGQQALDAYEELIESGLLAGSRRTELRRLRWQALINDAKLSMEREGEIDGALAKFKLALDCAKEIDDFGGRFEIIGLMGTLYERMGEVTTAIEHYYDEQLLMARGVNDEPAYELNALFNLALAYRGVRDFDLALKTLYLYKDLLKAHSFDTKRLAEADDEIKSTMSSKDLAKKIILTERKLESGSIEPSAKVYRQLAVDCRKLGVMVDSLAYARRCLELDESNRDALRICAALYGGEKKVEDALYYSKKLVDLYAVIEVEVDNHDMVDALMAVSQAYWLLPNLPSDQVRVLERALQYCRRTQGKDWEIEILSSLALTHQRLGNNEEYIRWRDECLQLWSIKCHSDPRISELEAKLVGELHELDYFVNRKPSKNVMKLVDGQFNLKSRTRGSKGLEIRKTRKKPIIIDDDPPKTKKVTRRILDDEYDQMKNAKELAHPYGNNQLGNEHHDAIDRSRGVDSHLEEFSLPDLPELIWPASPKKRTIDEDEKSQVSVTKSTSRRTWSGDPAFIGGIIRVKVMIFDDSLVIPVIDDITERKTIGWLIEEATHRHKEQFGGKEPMIEALLTEDGARLSNSDPVLFVLTDGQKVCARVSGYKRQTLDQIYRIVCQNFNGDEHPNIPEMLASFVKEVNLSLWLYDEAQFELVLRAVVQYNEICPVEALLVSNNRFVNDSMIQQLSLLKDLRYLDISFTSICDSSLIFKTFTKLEQVKCSFCPFVGLDEMIKILVASAEQCPLKSLDLKGIDLCGVNIGDLHYLIHLEALYLDFCPMNDDAGLLELRRKAPRLKTISARACT